MLCLAIRPARSHRVKVVMRLAPLPNDNCDSPLPSIPGRREAADEEEMRNKAGTTYGEVKSVSFVEIRLKLRSPSSSENLV